MYVKIANNKVIEYPANPYNDNPNVSFPENWSGGTVNKNEYALVEAGEMPESNSTHETVQEIPILKNGKWYQTWVSIERP